jgi:hypothetical protein
MVPGDMCSWLGCETARHATLGGAGGLEKAALMRYTRVRKQAIYRFKPGLSQAIRLPMARGSTNTTRLSPPHDSPRGGPRPLSVDAQPARRGGDVCSGMPGLGCSRGPGRVRWDGLACPGPLRGPSRCAAQACLGGGSRPSPESVLRAPTRAAARVRACLASTSPRASATRGDPAPTSPHPSCIRAVHAADSLIPTASQSSPLVRLTLRR